MLWLGIDTQVCHKMGEGSYCHDKKNRLYRNPVPRRHFLLLKRLLCENNMSRERERERVRRRMRKG